MLRSDCSCITYPNDPPIIPMADCPDCLTGSRPTIYCHEAPLPCGHFGVKTLSKSRVTGYFAVLDHDAAFIDVYFEGDTLHWRMNLMTGGDGEYGLIRYILRDTVDPLLSFRGEVRICKRNMCGTILPPAGKRCDPCTGLLVNMDPEVLIQNNPEVSI